MSLLMIFIDGFGLGAAGQEANPFLKAEIPFLKSLVGENFSRESVGSGIIGPELIIKPTDATLGVKGIPQSATGQTVLLAGVNAAAIAGRHLSGFPTQALRKILNQNSIFKVISNSGQRAVFANTFTTEYFETVRKGKARYSATTTAAMAGMSELRMVPDLLLGKAVYQDITNQQLIEKGYQVPQLEPEQAADRLVETAAMNDFTLFEYFQTDHCGHHQDWELAMVLLNRLDRFLGEIAGQLQNHKMDLLIVSDHGNIEDLFIKTHTLNLVPTIALGQNAGYFKEVESLLDIYPAILKLLGVPTPPSNIVL